MAEIIGSNLTGKTTLLRRFHMREDVRVVEVGIASGSFTFRECVRLLAPSRLKLLFRQALVQPRLVRRTAALLLSSIRHRESRAPEGTATLTFIEEGLLKKMVEPVPFVAQAQFQAVLDGMTRGYASLMDPMLACARRFCNALVIVRVSDEEYLRRLRNSPRGEVFRELHGEEHALNRKRIQDRIFSMMSERAALAGMSVFALDGSSGSGIEELQSFIAKSAPAPH